MAGVFEAAVEWSLLEDSHQVLEGTFVDVFFTYCVVTLTILRNKLADLFVLDELTEMGLKCELSYRQAVLGGFSGLK